jgi:hypothetical protein
VTNFISIPLVKASMAFSKLPALLDSLSTTAPARASAAAAADADPAQQVPMAHPSGVVPVVSLVVVKVELGCEIDLNLLARSAPNTEYKGKDACNGDAKKVCPTIGSNCCQLPPLICRNIP